MEWLLRSADSPGDTYDSEAELTDQRTSGVGRDGEPGMHDNDKMSCHERCGKGSTFYRTVGQSRDPSFTGSDGLPGALSREQFL